MATRFLVVEGCNGVGKSTVVKYLSDRVGASTFHYPPEFVSFRRHLRLDECLAPLPRLTYYLAATLHLSDLVRAQLKKSHVICDRYLASPLSLMLAESAVEEAEASRVVEPFASYLLRPDMTLLMTAGHAVACARIHNRSGNSGKLTPVAQRIIESESFFQQRQNVSRQVAMRLGPVVELDTTRLSPEEMCHSAWSLLAAKLNW